MTGSRRLWAALGVLVGAAGLVTSWVTAELMGIRSSPVVAVAEWIIRHTPGSVAESAIQRLGHADKPVLVTGELLFLAAAFAIAGLAARRAWWGALVVHVLLGLAGVVAVLDAPTSMTSDLLPVAVGFATWTIAMSVVTDPLRRATTAGAPPAGAPAGESAGAPAGEPLAASRPADGSTRRTVLVRAGVVAGLALLAGAAGRFLGAGRREVEVAREALDLDLSDPTPPGGTDLGVDGISAWQTPSDEFYLIHTALVVPTVKPADWSLRIRGMVDRELVLTYDDLLARQRTDAWVTLNCVSNPVGGDLIGNAWWGGVRIAPLLEEAGVQAGADAVLQTSEDGWTCGTPLAALTDDRDAMLVVAMNGRPLPIEHGFPVRTLVPGLYGYVSATKWVREFEVTRFDDIEAYWTQRGWGEMGPVKMSSRVDVPRSGSSVSAGAVRFGGVAWAQHTGISAVEVAVDDGEWQPMELGRVPSADTWVQWSGTVEVEPGDHVVRVRATDADGLVQTAEEADVLPDGATGHDAVDFTAT